MTSAAKIADICFAPMSRPAGDQTGDGSFSNSADFHCSVRKAQLQAFATGARRNDISEQMRNIARQMTPAEIDEAARYYAGRP
jgi:cytochrome c553